MKSTIDLTTCPLLTFADLSELLRSKDLATRCTYHSWIKPTSNTAQSGNGKNLFSRSDVDALIARIMSGEVPPEYPRPQKKEAA